MDRTIRSWESVVRAPENSRPAVLTVKKNPTKVRWAVLITPAGNFPYGNFHSESAEAPLLKKVSSNLLCQSPTGQEKRSADIFILVLFFVVFN